jgi:hypothetical protein
MTTIIVILAIWGVYRLLKGTAERRQAERAERERQRIREEQARIKEEQRRQKEWAKAETQRRIAIEKEQMAQRKEQERQAKIIAEHDERIAKAEQTIKQTTADIDFLRGRIAQLDTLLDLEKLEQAGAIPGSKTDIKCQKRIMTLENQIHSAESRLSKAQFNRRQAQEKLFA